MTDPTSASDDPIGAPNLVEVLPLPGDGRPDREPGGLASFLRRQQLGARFSGPSLPLDIGCADTVPASIRNAVRLRNRHCQWVGGYFL